MGVYLYLRGRGLDKQDDIVLCINTIPYLSNKTCYVVYILNTKYFKVLQFIIHLQKNIRVRKVVWAGNMFFHNFNDEGTYITLLPKTKPFIPHLDL